MDLRFWQSWIICYCTVQTQSYILCSRPIECFTKNGLEISPKCQLLRPELQYTVILFSLKAKQST